MLDPEKPKTKNALTHGVYSSEIVLPGESEEDFIELYKAFQSEVNPGSPLEHEAVLDLARLHWLKRRAIQAAKREFRHQQPIGQISAADQMELSKSTLMFKDKFIRAIKLVDELLSTISAERSTLDQMKERGKACEFPINEVRSHMSYFSTVRRMLFPDKEQATGYAYEPADLERVIKVEALIDTRIEKVLARLARIKEFRQLYGQADALRVRADPMTCSVE